MSSVTRALILSAGQGKRLLPLTTSRPKCLIDLSGKTLLEWQLQGLRAAGIREVVVVTGFKAEAVDAELARLSIPGLEVRTLFNPFYDVADNLASCWMAREVFDRELLLLNGDTLFEPAVAERLLAAPASEITVTVDRKAEYDADDMKVLEEGGRLEAIGKTITEYNAESIGFIRFSAAGAARFVAAIDAVIRSPGGLKRWYLSAIDELARDTGVVTVQSIEGLDWGEMDFPADVEANLALTERWVARRSAQSAA
ncbi:NTP transferase domain-containing protein [Phenylobacterium sp.]|uniref:phosphocholine cytidylyltransferase family protein n=1 Tax=Phenylobacterium sp. TaxID=1871053 RepID=UPI002B60111C|nr:NTP transferase domain-containing protein [Phenylobacterium sp.]HVI32883.1 NTP transferase domain-containing protein [Phenylobacterium sp.]